MPDGATIRTPDTEIIVADASVERVNGIVAGLSQATTITRDKILQLEAAMHALPGKVGADFYPLRHFFAPGTYGREMFIPAGHCVVGRLHKSAHLNIISMGDVTVLTEHEGRQRYTAPCTWVSMPGTKRVVFAHADTLWTCVHPTDETDLDKIEKEVIAETYEEYDALARSLVPSTLLTGE